MVPDIFIAFKSEDQRPRPGFFLILSGPSGVGKNTLLARVLKGVAGLYYIPSATTRPMRPGESQMNPYVFVTRSEFEEMIEQGQFLEWKKIHTNDYYGTHLPTIRYAIDHGYDIITDMDVLGCLDVAAAFPNNVRTIFVTPPSLDALSSRLLGRDVDIASVENRLSRVQMEMDYADRYNFVMVNDELDASTEKLRTIIESIIAV
ncbi:MAG: guanylate kinase [Firmicutes bacterium]|nr:guanylate kinase [Bacillota bacterium]